MSEKNTVCYSPLATRPILYTDTIKGEQTLRDDLWAVTTEELNEVEVLRVRREQAEKECAAHRDAKIAAERRIAELNGELSLAAKRIKRLEALVKTLSETADILTAQRDAAGWSKCWSDECVLPNGHDGLHQSVEAHAAALFQPSKGEAESCPRTGEPPILGTCNHERPFCYDTPTCINPESGLDAKPHICARPDCCAPSPKAGQECVVCDGTGKAISSGEVVVDPRCPACGGRE